MKILLPDTAASFLPSPETITAPQLTADMAAGLPVVALREEEGGGLLCSHVDPPSNDT
jgi:hypothetical protein